MSAVKNDKIQHAGTVWYSKESIVIKCMLEKCALDTTTCFWQDLCLSVPSCLLFNTFVYDTGKGKASRKGSVECYCLELSFWESVLLVIFSFLKCCCKTHHHTIHDSCTCTLQLRRSQQIVIAEKKKSVKILLPPKQWSKTVTNTVNSEE